MILHSNTLTKISNEIVPQANPHAKRYTANTSPLNHKDTSLPTQQRCTAANLPKSTPPPKRCATANPSVLRRYTVVVKNSKALLVSGAALLVISMVLYLYYGYHHATAGLWLAAIALTATHFLKSESWRQKKLPFATKDYVIAGILTIVIGCVYFSVNPYNPPQMVGDEVALTIKTLVVSEPGVDLFSPDDHYNWPKPFYAISGYMIKMVSHIDILNVRLFHTIISILVCTAAFFLFRRIFPDIFQAVLATTLLAFSHTFFAIGHMSILTNSAVLPHVLSLVFLLVGLQQRSKLYSFIGGVVAGFGWYVYIPAKSIIVVWLAALAILALLQKLKKFEKIKNLNLKKVIPATLIGFLFAVTPFLIGATTTPQEGHATWAYHQQQFLLTYEGHSYQFREIESESYLMSIRHNATNALTAFNRKIQDKGYMYSHWGRHGFVDPLTGALMWVGVLIVLLTARRQKTATILMVLHLLLLLLAFAFIVNRAPNYSRFLIMMPFVIPLVVIGLSSVIERTLHVVKSQFRVDLKKYSKLLVVLVALVIIYLNMGIFSDYLAEGKKGDEPISNIVRFIHTQANQEPGAMYAFDDTTQTHHQTMWTLSDWQRLWLNLFFTFNQPANDLTLKYYLSTRDRDYAMFGKERESISNTIYHVNKKMRISPHYFYYINTSDALHPPDDTFLPSDETLLPSDSIDLNDYKIWKNLFAVFRQPFEKISVEQFLSGEIGGDAVKDATLFVPSQIWSILHNHLPHGYTATEVRYLSAEKDLLIVVVKKED